MDIEKHYINQIEIIANIFTVEDGKIKVLLFRKQEDPFKGYWMLPSNLLMTTETIEECVSATIDEFTGLKNIYLKQGKVFSNIDRLPGARILGQAIICLIDIENIKNHFKENSINQHAWFNIDEIPKMIYDHGTILLDTIGELRKLLTDFNYMKIFYPKEFTLPELQKTYEHIYKKALDRRNFRKKLIHLNILEDTMDKDHKKNGRPAKLYCFKYDAKGDFTGE